MIPANARPKKKNQQTSAGEEPPTGDKGEGSSHVALTAEKPDVYL